MGKKSPSKILAKILDRGWSVRIYRNDLGSYTALATAHRAATVITDHFTVPKAVRALAKKVSRHEVGE